MEKNILTCVGEERRGRKETKNSLAQARENLEYRKRVELGKKVGYQRGWRAAILLPASKREKGVPMDPYIPNWS